MHILILYQDSFFHLAVTGYVGHITSCLLWNSIPCARHWGPASSIFDLLLHLNGRFRSLFVRSLLVGYWSLFRVLDCSSLLALLLPPAAFLVCPSYKWCSSSSWSYSFPWAISPVWLPSRRWFLLDVIPGHDFSFFWYFTPFSIR